MNYLELWQNAWPAGVIMLVVGLGFAIVLLIASVKLRVDIDPKIEQVHKVLPNINCGACGFAGCAQYAEALSKDPQLLGRCFPGGRATLEMVAKILNLQISDSGPPLKPVVHCRAYRVDKTYYAVYRGISTCVSANALTNAQACKFGCLGFGDCLRACKFNALRIVDDLATIDYDRCTGCGACSKSCPRNIIEMVPFRYEEMMAVACSSRENGKMTRSMCRVGCIACGICAKQSDMFSVEDNLARLDYQKYQPTEQSKAALDKCPVGVIVWVCRCKR